MPRPPATKSSHRAARRGATTAPEDGAAALAAPLEAWFAGAARDLPWRRERSGWRALVSELMLQQTQVARVVERFGPFLARFPTPEALATAPEDEVLALWQGLGYYRRARLLQSAARAIVERHAGEVPADRASLEALPGVGRYTAGAVASIAFGRREAIVDGNVARVLQRVFAREGSSADRAVTGWAWTEATRFVEAAERPGLANEALMEFGATVCTPAAPRCQGCPLAGRCLARRTGRTDAIPAPKPRAARRALVLVSARIERTDGALLLEQRPATGLWARLWQPPTAESDDGAALSAAAAASLLGLSGIGGPTLESVGEIPFQTTHRDVRFVVFQGRVRGDGARLATNGRRWATRAELPSIALSNAARRVVDAR
jgi:A/G-specific adenine glycosylase